MHVNHSLLSSPHIHSDYLKRVFPRRPRALRRLGFRLQHLPSNSICLSIRLFFLFRRNYRLSGLSVSSFSPCLSDSSDIGERCLHVRRQIWVAMSRRQAQDGESVRRLCLQIGPSVLCVPTQEDVRVGVPHSLPDDSSVGCFCLVVGTAGGSESIPRLQHDPLAYPEVFSLGRLITYSWLFIHVLLYTNLRFTFKQILFVIF